MKHTKALSLITKLILGFVAVFILAYIVKVSMNTYSTAKKIGNILTDELYETYENMVDKDLKQLDQTDINGSNVINYIKKYLGELSDTESNDFFMRVITKKSDNTYWNGSCLDKIKSFTHLQYIKPTASFSVDVLMQNKVILGLIFTEN